MSDTLASLIRTGVPYLIGLVITWAASLGITLPDDAKDSILAIATFVIGTVYYLIVRGLENKWPWIGGFLGVPKQPVYAAPPVGEHVATADIAAAPKADVAAGPPADDAAGDAA